MTFDDVIENHFGDYQKTKYFQSSDAHVQIEGTDTYLRYEKVRGRVELYFGGDSGEVCLKVCTQPEDLNDLIKAMIR